MSDKNSNLKTCSKCRCVMLETYFDTNRKGELFKTCNRCRERALGFNAKSRETHYDDVRVCEKCGQEVKYSNSLGTHMRTWKCFRTAHFPKGHTSADFRRWLLDNKDNLLSRYKLDLRNAEANFCGQARETNPKQVDKGDTTA